MCQTRSKTQMVDFLMRRLKIFLFQATAQMEERLQTFLDYCRQQQHSGETDAITSFLLHQVMELARDCLEKSQEKLITSVYLFELSDKLEKLLIDVSLPKP